eukprot:scaffold67224_cov55-Phaeocystis_antarctica.AAC.1
MEPVVAIVLRMESVYLMLSATSTPATREVAAWADGVAASRHRVCGPKAGGDAYRPARRQRSMRLPRRSSRRRGWSGCRR